MFNEIIEKIESKDYCKAKDALLPLTTKGEAKDIAYAYYLLGYIYNSYDNLEADEKKAKKYLHHNLTSDYPHPHAYYLFARVAEDKNIKLFANWDLEISTRPIHLEGIVVVVSRQRGCYSINRCK